nr:Spo0B C-terminal domain-containing protein [Bacillus kexueae]
MYNSDWNRSGIVKKYEDSWSIVELLSHSRHDWMNKLQLLKGNLALKKYERAKEIIDEIVMEAQHESKLCNLHMKRFAEYILTHNWRNPVFPVEFVVLGEAMRLTNLDDQITNWTEVFFNRIEKAVEPNHEHEMIITIETDRKEDIRFVFQFHGILHDRGELLSFLNEKTNMPLNVHVIKNESSEITVHVTINLDEVCIQ